MFNIREFVSFTKNTNGKIVSIETIVYQSLPLVYVRAPDAKKNKSSINLQYSQDISGMVFDRKQYFVMNSCRIVEEIVQEVKYITVEELGKHKSKKDRRIARDTKVYNISQYVSRHPGGEIILRAAGKDATQLFNKHHPWVNANALISSMQVGILK